MSHCLNVRAAPTYTEMWKFNRSIDESGKPDVFRAVDDAQLSVEIRMENVTRCHAGDIWQTIDGRDK